MLASLATFANGKETLTRRYEASSGTIRRIDFRAGLLHVGEPALGQDIHSPFEKECHARAHQVEV